ncbi:MAG: FtsQ-type POTRA domain-containing protein [Desulfobacterales bacterium]|nr:FtsQ-type POTRA domain-containing protein [Desulfobacterales bacterium]MCP4160349.1 FtsQ-type POTRA domain-containing protein [Deltaproteobacteria bacterium]
MSVPKRIEKSFSYFGESKKKRKPFFMIISSLLWLICTVTITCILGFVFIYAHDSVNQSSYFTTEKIKVTGHRYLSKKEIVEYGNLKTGMNLFSINTFILERRLKNHPWIKNVYVERDLPGCLKIDITEYKEVAVVDLGKKYLIDQEGVPFKRFDKSESLKIPLIKGLKKEDILSGDNKIYMSVLDILKTIKSEVVHKYGIKEVVADNETGLVIKTAKVEKLKICFDDFEQKFIRALKILNFMEDKGKKITSMDLCNLNRIVVKQALPAVK